MSAIQVRKATVSMSSLVWGIVILAWALAVVSLLTGQERLINHDAILGHQRIPSLGTLILFVAAWQVMVAGMMLPSSVPMIRAFARASEGQEHPRLARVVFVLAYFVVWTGFAVVALASDDGLHSLVDHWPWLDQHEFIISATLLAIAGLFQFSSLKEKCLQECRSPMSFFWRYYQRGVGPAWRLGIRHGIFCLGCCWALMLVMFGVGITNMIWWLAALTGVMVLEKTTRWGHRLVPFVGVSLISLGLLALVMPGIL